MQIKCCWNINYFGRKLIERRSLYWYTQPKGTIKQNVVTKHNALWNSWGYWKSQIKMVGYWTAFWWKWQGISWIQWARNKTRTGENSTHLRAFRPKQFANPDDPSNCPVTAFKIFRDRRPPATKTAESPFYIAVNHKRAPDAEFWYKNQPLGENSLRSIMKVMANKANLLGKETNHSARKSTCTRLLHAGIAPTTIQQLTGHKNVQSINNYAIASIEMQKNMSDILTNKEIVPNKEL